MEEQRREVIPRNSALVVVREEEPRTADIVPKSVDYAQKGDFHKVL